jgi:kinesin family protein 4/21/27
MNDDHFRELKNINQSLTTLGKVIASLSNTKTKSVAPFRESKLTRLLQDSLSGNTFTFIIGNISPSIKNIDETMNTLKFVERARHVVCILFRLL